MIEKAAALCNRGLRQTLVQIQFAEEDEGAGLRRGRRLALALAILCGVGILLASLYPFERIHDPVQLVRQWQRFLSPWRFDSHATLRFRLGHLIGNFLFYFPLGVTVWLALRRDAHGRAAVLSRAFALTLGLVLSLTMEFLQIGFAHREPDLTDSAMNTLGYLAGFLLMRRIMRHEAGFAFLRWLLAPDSRTRMARVVSLIYAPLVLIIVIYPFEPLREISQVLEWLGLHLGFSLYSNPSLLSPWTLGRAAGVALYVCLFAPLGFFIRSAFQRWNAPLLSVCLLAVLGVAATMQDNWRFDRARILGGAVGALAGICLANWRMSRPGRGRADCNSDR